MPERAEHEARDTGNRAELALLIGAPLRPLSRHEQLRPAPIDSTCVRRSHMIRQCRKAMSVEIVLDEPPAAMHRPELMPHRWTLRRVLIDDQVVDQAAANPVAPVQRGVSERRPEHVAACHADANPPIFQSPSLEFDAKLSQQPRDVIALQIPPGVELECVAQDVDAVPATDIRPRSRADASGHPSSNTVTYSHASSPVSCARAGACAKSSQTSDRDAVSEGCR